MASASYPKKMHLVGSDGGTFRFLAKPLDDLRRDMRVMEYASLLNRLLADDVATRAAGTQVRANPGVSPKSPCFCARSLRFLRFLDAVPRLCSCKRSSACPWPTRAASSSGSSATST